MKKKMKVLIKLFSLILLTILASCEKDIYEEHIHNEHLKNSISLEQFKKETGIIDFKTSIKIPVSSENSSLRTASLSDFNIDTELILKLINQDNKVTYSFKIEPVNFVGEENEKFNLVYLKEDDVWQYSILAFKEANTTNQNQNIYQTFENLYDTRLANYTTLSFNTELCYSESYTVHCTDNGPCSIAEGRCDGCWQCVTRFVNIFYCGGSSGTPSGSNGNPSNGNGGTNSSTPDPFDFTPNDGSTPFQDTPCNSLKNATDPTKGDLKLDIDWLKTKVDEPKEFGVEVEMRRINNEFRYPTIRKEDGQQYGIKLRVGRYRIGGGHSHPKNSYAIPSYGDLRWLLSCRDSVRTGKEDEVFSMIVCKSKDGTINVYALKINNLDDLRNKVNAIWNDPIYATFTNEKDRLDEIHKNEANKYSKNENELEKIFLQKYGSFGIDLYKATDDTLSQWNILELGSNPDTTSPNQLIVIPNPC